MLVLRLQLLRLVLRRCNLRLQRLDLQGSADGRYITRLIVRSSLGSEGRYVYQACECQKPGTDRCMPVAWWQNSGQRPC